MPKTAKYTILYCRYPWFVFLCVSGTKESKTGQNRQKPSTRLESREEPKPGKEFTSLDRDSAQIIKVNPQECQLVKIVPWK